MHGDDWTLVYCNQWKCGSVTPLAKAVHGGSVNNCRWSKDKDIRGWSHKADIMFIFRLWIKWAHAFYQACIRFSLFQPFPSKRIPKCLIYLIFRILSSQYRISVYSLFIQFWARQSLSRFPDRLNPLSCVWVKLLSQQRPADQMLAVFIYF